MAEKNSKKSEGTLVVNNIVVDDDIEVQSYESNSVD